jgi:hypothetical protein
MPELRAPRLPAGFRDGWYRGSDGTVHVLTLHATYFALLRTDAKCAAPFTAALLVAETRGAGRPKQLSVTVTPSLPVQVVFVLRGKGSTIVARKTAVLAASLPARVALALPFGVRAGSYRLSAVVTAGKSSVSGVLPIRIA